MSRSTATRRLAAAAARSLARREGSAAPGAAASRSSAPPALLASRTSTTTAPPPPSRSDLLHHQQQRAALATAAANDEATTTAAAASSSVLLTPTGALAADAIDDALRRATSNTKGPSPISARAYLAQKQQDDPSARLTTADLLQWARGVLDEAEKKAPTGAAGTDATSALAAARRRLDALAALFRLQPTAPQQQTQQHQTWLPDAAPPPPSLRAVVVSGDPAAASLPAAASPLGDLLLRVAGWAAAARVEALPDARFKAQFEYPLAEASAARLLQHQQQGQQKQRQQPRASPPAATPGAVRAFLSAHAQALLPPRRWADALAVPAFWRHAAVELNGGPPGKGNVSSSSGGGGSSDDGGGGAGGGGGGSGIGAATNRRQRSRARQRRALAVLSGYDAERALAASEARRAALGELVATMAATATTTAPPSASSSSSSSDPSPTPNLTLFNAAARALGPNWATGARLLHPDCAQELEAALAKAVSGGGGRQGAAWRGVAALRAGEAVAALLGVTDDDVAVSSPLLAVAMAQRLTGQTSDGAFVVKYAAPGAASAEDPAEGAAAAASSSNTEEEEAAAPAFALAGPVITATASFADPALKSQLQDALPKLAAHLAEALTPAQLAAPGSSPLGALPAAEALLAREAPALRGWRLAAAASGSSGDVAVLCTLARDEVAAMSKEQAAAVRARVARLEAAWEASVEPRLRQAAAGGGDGALPWAVADGAESSSSSSSSSSPQQVSAVDAIAWRLHKALASSPPSSSPDARLEAAERAVLSLALRAAAGAARHRAASAAADASAVDAMVVAFALERELARLDPTYAPRPGALLTGGGGPGTAGDGAGPIDALLAEAAAGIEALGAGAGAVLATAGEPGGSGGGGGSGSGSGGSSGITTGDLLSSWLRAGGRGGDIADLLLPSAAGGAAASEAERALEAAAAALAPGPTAALGPQLRSELGALMVNHHSTTDAEALRARVRAFASALDAEVAALESEEGSGNTKRRQQRRGGGGGAGGDASSSFPGADEPVSNLRQRGAAASLAPDALSGVALLPNSVPRGLAELLGEREARQVAALVAGGGGGGGGGSGGGGRGSSSSSSSLPLEEQPFEMLERVHADIETQRLLAVEMDPRLDMDLLHPPRPAADPALWLGGGGGASDDAKAKNKKSASAAAAAAAEAFLDGMRPLLDGWLTAQGEHPTRDVEWRVYRAAALLEHRDERRAAERAHAALGGSGLRSAAADEAVLRARLDAGLPEGSPLRASALKYLAAACRNRTWTFAQRQRLVDRLVEVAAHLEQHPPAARGAKGARGSPFSALFEEGGPPLAPRFKPLDGEAMHGKVAALLPSQTGQGKADEPAVPF